MHFSAAYLSASEAARQLGVSTKALRLYEQRGLIAPLRTDAGWRAYGPDQIARAGEIAALRALGLGLARIARVLDGGSLELGAALAAQRSELEERLRRLAAAMRELPRPHAGHVPDETGGGGRPGAPVRSGISFALGWPWDGEAFELPAIRPITYIVGPLGSGKTRLARQIAETLPEAAFIGLDRLDAGRADVRARMIADRALGARVEAALDRLVGDGAEAPAALLALLLALESDGPAALVVDMVEEGLDHATQERLIRDLRRRRPGSRPLFLLTRSSAILNLAAVDPHEAMILCPANHAAPLHVSPVPGSPGFEALASCLATPAVRARTAGVVAWRPAAV